MLDLIPSQQEVALGLCRAVLHTLFFSECSLGCWMAIYRREDAFAVFLYRSTKRTVRFSNWNKKKQSNLSPLKNAREIRIDEKEVRLDKKTQNSPGTQLFPGIFCPTKFSTCAYKYVLQELLGHNFAKSHRLRKFKFLCKTVCILVKTTKKRCLFIKWTPSPVVVSYMGAQLAVRTAGYSSGLAVTVHRWEVCRIQIGRGSAFIVLWSFKYLLEK